MGTAHIACFGDVDRATEFWNSDSTFTVKCILNIRNEILDIVG